MDAFTEKILLRARERQRLLRGDGEILNANSDDHKSLSTEENTKCIVLENNLPSKVEVTKPSEITSRRGSGNSPRTKTLNFHEENLNMEIRVTSSDDVRVEVEFEDANEDSEDVIKNVGLRKDAKDRLNRLGKLYSGGDEADISSPIHRTEEKFLAEVGDVCSSKIEPKTSGKGLSRLANLADKINHWEDDLKPSKKNIETTKTKKEEKNPQRPPPQKLRPSMVPGSPVSSRINRLNGILQKSNTTPTQPSGPKNEELVEKKTDNKSIKWDKSVLDSLESQGFQRREEDSSMVYDYATEKIFLKNQSNVKGIHESKENNIPKTKNISSANGKTAGTAVSDKVSHFESSISKSTPDPSSLSISERKALFEKNNGEILLPKVPFGMPLPVQTNKTNDKPVSSKNSSSVTAGADRSSVTPKRLSPCKKIPSSPTTVNTGKSASVSPRKKNAFSEHSQNAPQSPIKSHGPVTGGIAAAVAALCEKSNTISQSQIENQVKESRKRDMEMLHNRFNRNKELYKTAIAEENESSEEESSESSFSEQTSPTSNMPSVQDHDSSFGYKRKSDGKRQSVSPKVAAVLEDVKRIKVSPAKPGQLYPSLSDIETGTETEVEDRSKSPTPNNSSIESTDDGPNMSFGREVMDAVCKVQTPHKRSIYDESSSDISDVLGDMDEYLEGVLNSDEENSSLGPTPPKQAKSKAHTQSHSFSYKKYDESSPFRNKSKISTEHDENNLPTHVVDGKEVLPLTHTVSFYRKQTATSSSVSPQKRTVISEEVLSEEEDSHVITQKIQSLQEQVNKQQLIIAQTSQALNLCNSTLEFMGSIEQVEAERVLLLSTHRRQAMLNEIQRLKVEKTLRPRCNHADDLPLEKGTLVISNVTLPLKKEYVRALAAAGGKGHHVTCLVKCGEEVMCSKLVSTVASDIKNPSCQLSIPGTISFKNIYSDFAVSFEVYCLQAQEEFLPHDVKYHIKKGNKATPKKNKNDSLLSRPIKESPAGPQAVRSTSFASMGYVVFSIHQINKKTWRLNNTPSMSPLEGSIEMTISCELTSSVEHRGFLTMFDDISGFGAWHRRWFLLKENSLSYWKYPDEEKKKPPMDTIDLRDCITKEVKPVSKEICARLHTFLLETVRDPLPQDKDSLVVICKPNKTIVRHLLSADTKDDRLKWCAMFNSALTSLKLWGNTANRQQ